VYILFLKFTENPLKVKTDRKVTCFVLRRSDVSTTTTLLITIYKQTTESTGTLLNALPAIRTAINESLWKAD